VGVSARALARLRWCGAQRGRGQLPGPIAPLWRACARRFCMTVVPPNSVDRAAADRNDLLLRLASAVVLAPIALVATALGGWAASVTTALFSIIVVLEWMHIVGQGRSAGPRDALVAVTASAFVAAAAIAGGMAALATGSLIALLGALIVAAL